MHPAIAVQDDARAGHGAMHLFVKLDAAAVGTVAQRQVKPGLPQAFTHVRKPFVLQLGVSFAFRHIGHRKMGENPF